MTIQTPNPLTADQSPIVEFWNDILAPKVIRFRHIMVDGLSLHSQMVMPQLPVAPGDDVLDVGCGFGDTAYALAQRTGPEGTVLGVDCCQAFLDLAWRCPERMFNPNVRFANGDAERDLGEHAYDFVFSRFGTMFFVNPVAGLRAMCRALRPGGQMAHIVWRNREDNPWLAAARETVLQFLPAPGEDARTCGPGPFSMADEAATRAKMTAAGFTDIAFRRIDAKVLVGRTVADAIAFQLALGPAGETFREAGPLAEERRPQIEAALADLFAGVETNPEGLWMDSSSWLITARAPETA
ncbi:class I SAM-dependent methyltransferase [Actibacterium sp. XHP0104]|uniref:class I SAM-dependent methyltransferase n=1 Tax=Actibacterium sp. XHP0104 TaxID=2984335 RepID=UPI0021E71ACD|nr:class I SAM-dependent methyltransferase [Actibacterium sp. XHP0104]MCV2880406.1 class I SAM-dependent methyltransferase [Actibacterium sp. XHP0104]